MLPDSPAELTTVYSVRQLEQDRVAGDCHWTGTSRDNACCAYHFCIEDKTSLPLRISVINSRREVIEAIHLQPASIGPVRDKTRFAPPSTSSIRSCRPAAMRGRPPTARIKVTPAGFRLLRDVRRTMSGRSQSVRHLVYSDGFGQFLGVHRAGGGRQPFTSGRVFLPVAALRAYSRAGGRHPGDGGGRSA